MEEEVLDKYKVEESKRGAFKGRGNPLEWRRVRNNKTYKIRKWREDSWVTNISLFRLQSKGGANRRGDEGSSIKGWPS